MSGQVYARAHANVDSLRKGEIVCVDPDDWRPHFQTGILTRVSDTELAEAGFVPDQNGNYIGTVSA